MEKSQLPCWASVAIITVLALVGIAIWRCLEHPSELPAWVQAIGTIIAIVAAFLVGRQGAEHAHNLQMERETRERLRIEHGYKNVVLNLISQALSIAKIMTKNDVATFRAAWESFLGPTASACLAALDALPMHDLGSSERIQIAFAIREEAQDFFGKIASLPRYADPQLAYSNLINSDLEPLHQNLREFARQFEETYSSPSPIA